jgi:hypothetical protein
VVEITTLCVCALRFRGFESRGSGARGSCATPRGLVFRYRLRVAVV